MRCAADFVAAGIGAGQSNRSHRATRDLFGVLGASAGIDVAPNESVTRTFQPGYRSGDVRPVPRLDQTRATAGFCRDRTTGLARSECNEISDQLSWGRTRI